MDGEKNIDRRIADALASNSELDLHANEQSLLEQVQQIFQGRNRWSNALMAVIIFFLMGFSCYAAYRFYCAVEVKELIAWSIAITLGMMFISMLKIWAWLEMEKYSTIREIKRLELQLLTLHEQWTATEAKDA